VREIGEATAEEQDRRGAPPQVTGTTEKKEFASNRTG